MKTSMKKTPEILIVRNAIFRSKYDVVEVDFIAEEVQVIQSNLDFEEAVALQELLKPEYQDKGCSYEEDEKEDLI